MLILLLFYVLEWLRFALMVDGYYRRLKALEIKKIDIDLQKIFWSDLDFLAFVYFGALLC